MAELEEEFGGDLGVSVKTQEVERVTGKKGVGGERTDLGLSGSWTETPLCPPGPIPAWRG